MQSKTSTPLGPKSTNNGWDEVGPVTKQLKTEPGTEWKRKETMYMIPN